MISIVTIALGITCALITIMFINSNQVIRITITIAIITIMQSGLYGCMYGKILKYGNIWIYLIKYYFESDYIYDVSVWAYSTFMTSVHMSKEWWLNKNGTYSTMINSVKYTLWSNGMESIFPLFSGIMMRSASTNVITISYHRQSWAA